MKLFLKLSVIFVITDMCMEYFCHPFTGVHDLCFDAYSLTETSSILILSTSWRNVHAIKLFGGLFLQRFFSLVVLSLMKAFTFPHGLLLSPLVLVAALTLRRATFMAQRSILLQWHSFSEKSLRLFRNLCKVPLPLAFRGNHGFERKGFCICNWLWKQWEGLL